MKLLMTKLWKIWMRLLMSSQIFQNCQNNWNFLILLHFSPFFCKSWIVNEIVNYIDKLAILSTITFHESLTLVENLKRVNVWGKFVSFLRKNMYLNGWVAFYWRARAGLKFAHPVSSPEVMFICIPLLNHKIIGLASTISRSSSKIYLFSFENIQNS